MPPSRPDLVAEARGQVSGLELFQTALVRRSFDSKAASTALKWLQRSIGTRWITLVTSRISHSHHLERVPVFGPNESCIIVCNHRSFFDLYIVTTALLKHGLTQRIVFPVRSNFFYDNPLGLAINGAMSFFAMYPPIYRERNKAALNLLGLDELVWLLQSGGTMLGFHPEGTRNRDNPYQLLPARTGIGRLIHQARVPVVPVFTNGLLVDDLGRQVKSNFDGSGMHIHTVFGAPIDFGSVLTEPASQGVFKRIANQTRDAIMALGREEAELRRAHGHAFVDGSVVPAPPAASEREQKRQ
jgi:1-acyl-sn-glycerol-3-phosphate acyltransferase